MDIYIDTELSQGKDSQDLENYYAQPYYARALKVFEVFHKL